MNKTMDPAPESPGFVPGTGDSIFSLKGYDPMVHNLTGLDALHQDRGWITKDGTRLTLDAMEPSHRANLLRWLRRRASALELRDALAVLRGPFSAQGEMAMDFEEDMLDAREADPAGWLEGTKLVTRLRGMVAADEWAGHTGWSTDGEAW